MRLTGVTLVLLIVVAACTRTETVPSTVSFTSATPTTTTTSANLATVPDVVGMTLDRAIALVEQAGLEMRVHEGDPLADNSVVESQEPSGGTEIRAGSAVGVRTLLREKGPPEAARPKPFVPETSVEAEQRVLQVAFPDGSLAELAYPAEVDITSLGVYPYSSGSTPNTARDFRVYHGRVADVVESLGGAEILETYRDLQGRPVQFLHLDLEAQFNQLAYQFDEWTVFVWDYRPGSTGSPMREENRRTWVISLVGAQDAAGYLLLQSFSPLELAQADGSHSPELFLSGKSGSLGLGANHCQPFVDTESDPASGFFAWCDESSGIEIQADGTEEFVTTMLEHLEIRNVVYAPDLPGFGEGIWTGPDGETVDDDIVLMQSGFQHCDSQAATFLMVSWPLGTPAEHIDDSRQYIRHGPAIIGTEYFTKRYDGNATLPDDAEFSGYREVTGIELWLSPSDQEEIAYLVFDGHVEAWPRAVVFIGCA